MTDDEYNLAVDKLGYYFDNQDNLTQQQHQEFTDLVISVGEYEFGKFPELNQSA